MIFLLFQTMQTFVGLLNGERYAFIWNATDSTVLFFKKICWISLNKTTLSVFILWKVAYRYNCWLNLTRHLWFETQTEPFVSIHFTPKYIFHYTTNWRAYIKCSRSEPYPEKFFWACCASTKEKDNHVWDYAVLLLMNLHNIFLKYT